MPYIEERALYEQFKLDEPWDSEHNLRLVERMPRLYEAPWKKYVDVPPHHTVLHVFVGPGAAFEWNEPAKQTTGKAGYLFVGPKAAFEWNRGFRPKDDFPDGTSHTLLYVEAGPPVPWTKPEEIPFESGQPIRLRGLFRDGYRAGTVDGAGYRFIRHDADECLLRASITRNGGEALPPVWHR